MTVVDGPVVYELLFSSTDEGIVEDKGGDKKIIWKDILREGDFAITPGHKKAVPFKVIPTGKSSRADRTISMSELMQSYEDKAFESVTIPLRHPKPEDDTDVLNNTGYVEGLRIVKKGDKHYMQAGLGFTEPDVAGKVRRGTIPNVSSGIFFDWVRKADAKHYPVALNHVALAKQPWIPDLEPFKRVFASDEAFADDDLQIEVISLDGGGEDGGDDQKDKATIVWNEQASTNWIRQEIRASLSPDVPEVEGVPAMPRPYYEVLDVSREDTALVEEWFKGDRKRWVIPYEVSDNKVTVSPATRWVEVREAMIAASDDLDKSTYTALKDRLSTELQVMLGDAGESFRIQDVTVDGRVTVKNSANSSVYLAQYVSNGDTVLLSHSSEWERLVAPSRQDAAPAPNGDLPRFDMTTPEGRVAAARQQRRQIMSSKSQ